MMNKVNTNTSEKLFSNKELYRITWRWSKWLATIWNYEKMEAAGYLITMAPVLDKIYQDDEQARLHAYEVESQFFNCETNLAAIIFGIDIAIQEEFKEAGLDMAQAVKTSLMGPFSGIGDTLFSSVFDVIFGSIAVTTGLQGNYIGILLWAVWIFFVPFFLRPWFCRLGYREGIKLTMSLNESLGELTKCGTILGLTVIGAMIATMVNVKFGTIQFDSFKFDVQKQLFDAIMPSIGSGVIALLCYKFLDKFGMKSARLIYIVILISLVLSYFGILVV
ncbi:PTS system mannose/fructose/sorbose family transporter subunit IID [Clostridiaceae bacterium DONG20-135]|uniref:PTS system mannose/fructose/sorbose family transporter subunit IID n=1 Tax=Copranaerobaculum intestinale TaxID=2692629 RepID=A0A6N8UG45_9FIRM|nr:PTS system mannose/fructose/sorbose family transporter subunit IID [Copranaerobaculum intestinale]MXQ74237.1 PTS system mannose/fructose/sorbose family transporter subunit IID [Copranaerobaculum intestinale]